MRICENLCLVVGKKIKKLKKKHEKVEESRKKSEWKFCFEAVLTF